MTSREPPEPLAPRLWPSVRHPEGLPRCQRWRIRDGQFRQCKRAARPGFRTCGHHGAGFAKREREGNRKNPALARITTGRHAKTETLKVWSRSEPSVLPLYLGRLIEQKIAVVETRLLPNSRRRSRGRRNIVAW